MKYTDEHIQQQIEAYLNQNMSDLERSRFEKLIHDDPELHEEVELQEATMAAIRNERMLALKAGLSQVNVSLWSLGLIEAAKIAAVVAGVGIAGAGGYFIYQQQHKQPLRVTQITGTEGSAETTQAVTQKPMEQGVTEPQVVSEAPDSKPFEANRSNGEAPAQNASPASASRTVTPFPGSKPVPSKGIVLKVGAEPGEAKTEEAFEPNTKAIQPLTGKDVPLPEDGISNKTSIESIQPEVVLKKDNKNIFHYQFSENKLVLYADFSDKLYEVLELNQDNTRRMFFCYDGRFYQLDPAQTEISPLKEVQDRSLIQILTAYQKRKN